MQKNPPEQARAGFPGRHAGDRFGLLALFAVTPLEPLDHSGGIDELLFSRIEGVAGTADLKPHLFFGRAGLERVPAGAANIYLVIIRMNSGFHITSTRPTGPRRRILHLERP